MPRSSRSAVKALAAAAVLASCLAHGPTAYAAGMPSCFDDPSMPMCADADNYYTSAMIHKDLDMACGMMPYMSGCSIKAACSSEHVSSKMSLKDTVPGAHGTPCEPWTLLFDVCTSMPDMMGCEHFTSLCGNSSTVVKQCSNYKRTPALVPYNIAARATVSMCSSMPGMSGCSTCTSDQMSNLKSKCPNPLLSLSQVCMSMKGMPKCDPWTKMCTQSQAGTTTETFLPEFCDDQWTNSSAPGDNSCRASGMQMTFHGGLHDAVLFKDWYACTGWQYFIVLVLVFTVSAASSGLRSVRPSIERNALHLFACHWGSRMNSSGSSSSSEDTQGDNLGLGLIARKELYGSSLIISGMTCQACVSTVTQALIGVKECVSASVDLRSSHALVSLTAADRDSALEVSKRMVQSVEDVGFEAKLEKVWPGSFGGQGCCRCFKRDSPYPKSLIRSLFTAIQMSVDYALMLAAMTFNTGVFFAVVVGYSFPVPSNWKPGAVIQLTAHYGPAIQVTVPEGMEPGQSFAVEPGSIKWIETFERGGEGWRHHKKEVSCSSGIYWNIICCAPCFLAKTQAILRTGNANAPYYYCNLPCRNCCSNDETAMSVCIAGMPMSFCGPLWWRWFPTEGIDFTDFYKKVRDGLGIPHVKSGCCYETFCEKYGSSRDVGQIYLELRSRAKLTVDSSSEADDNIIRITNNKLVDHLYNFLEEELDTEKQGDPPMSANDAPETQNMTRGGPYVVKATEAEMQSTA
eukprot:g2917.t1